MRLFQCACCGQVLLFENTHCERCKSAVGFEPISMSILSLKPTATTGQYQEVNASKDKIWQYCNNFDLGVCNWLLEASTESEKSFCLACELNRYIPNIQTLDNLEGWRALEFAKHRVVYSLLMMKLPVESKKEGKSSGIRFDFINTNQVIPADAHTMTGHANGKITITLNEAHSAKREQMRLDLNERYRTLLGHLRHEIGHYYWDVLISDNPKWLRRYRALFGDERADYGKALQQYYDVGPKADWSETYVTKYASSHPWEDWAETWSHYLHLTDTMETAVALGVSVQPPFSLVKDNLGLRMQTKQNPYVEQDFNTFLNNALALTFAANCLNRSMGQPDLYPFVLTPHVRMKLNFIHDLLRDYVVNLPLQQASSPHDVQSESSIDGAILKQTEFDLDVD